MGALKVVTNGQTLVVTSVTNGAGSSVGVWSDSGLSSAVTLPVTISSDTTYYLQPGNVNVTVSQSDGTVIDVFSPEIGYENSPVVTITPRQSQTIVNADVSALPGTYAPISGSQVYARNASASTAGASLAAVKAIPNLVWCFTPETGFYTDQAGTTQAVNSGDAVKCWKNGVGTDHATTASSGLTLAEGVAGGVNALNVNGSGTRLLTTGTFDSSWNAGFTEFVVAYDAAQSANKVIASSGDNRYYHNRLGASNSFGVVLTATSAPTPRVPYDIATAAAVNPEPIKPGYMVEAFRYSGPSSPIDFWFHGLRTTSTASATSLALTGVLNIGGLASGGFQWGGQIVAYIAFNRALTNTEVQVVYNYLSGLGRTTPRPKVQMIGNSLFAGSGTSTGITTVPGTAQNGYAQHGKKDLPSQLLDLYPADDVSIRVDAYPGRTTQQIASDIVSTSMPMFAPAGHPTQVAVVWEVTNDIQQNSAAAKAAVLAGSVPAPYTNYVSVCQTLRAQGWIVAAVTCLPRGDSGTPFYMIYQDVNQRIRKNWPTFADLLIDVAQDPRIGLPGCESNTTYFNADTVHLNDEGCRVAANIMRQALGAWTYSAPAPTSLSKSVAGATDVTLTALEGGTVTLPGGNGIVTLTGAITANINVVLPLTKGAQATFYNNTTGAFTVTLKSATGTGYTITQGKKARAYCDGTNWVQATPEV